MNCELLIDLHKDNARQGPGSENHTKMAIALSGLSRAPEKLRIADIGCGTGASTLVLARAIALQSFSASLAALAMISRR